MVDILIVMLTKVVAVSLILTVAIFIDYTDTNPRLVVEELEKNIFSARL